MAIPFVRSAQAIASLRGSSLLCNMQVLCLKIHNCLLHTRVNLACPAHQAFKPSKSSPRLRRHAPRAADKGKSSKGGLDWDSAWSNFKDGLNKNIPVVEDRTAQRPESQQQPSPVTNHLNLPETAEDNCEKTSKSKKTLYWIFGVKSSSSKLEECLLQCCLSFSC